MAWRIAVDIGGTFTDVVALEEKSGQLHLAKVPSSTEDPSVAFINSVKKITSDHNIEPRSIDSVFHGTTVATNAIIERKYSKIGLIVTDGYRESLEVARQTVPGDFGDITWWIKPDRVVPLEFVREVEGRIDVNGIETDAIIEEQVKKVVEEFKTLGVEAIAISLLHSYRNPQHEREVRDIVEQSFKDCHISISSDILREYREYERTNTTCLNTALMPLLTDYHEKLATNLESLKISSPFYIMRSSGGLAQAEEISKQPITAALSGPAAGVIAATHFGVLAEMPNLICFDVGGTSADICLVEQGKPRMLTEGRVDIYDVKTPMIDIHAVGAGGGSIAWLAGGRSLKVGPDSAGSSPGPACYGKGGTEPTVTDANMVLGRLTSGLVGGDLALDPNLAEVAVKKIAEPLGLDLLKAADGILRIAIENMAAGIRNVSVKRGRDPRDYALLAFGGAGPLHACYLAEWLGMERILIPPSPGVTSAYGLLLTDVRIDQVHTDVQRDDKINMPRVQANYQQLQKKVTTRLKSEGFDKNRSMMEYFVDVRYAGQAYEIRCHINANTLKSESKFRESLEQFHEHHQDLYGYSYKNREAIEIVNLGVTGMGLLTRPKVPTLKKQLLSIEESQRSEVEIYFPTMAGKQKCFTYQRELLGSGAQIKGPAVIEQYDSTTVIHPNWTAAVDNWGNLKISYYE